MRKVILAALAFLVLPAVLWAQPLSDCVPADAMIYVGWTGTDSMGAAYEGSRLKGLLESSGFPQMARDFLPRLIQRIARDDRGAAQIMQVFTDIAGPMCRHPSALFVAPINWESPTGPAPRAAIICQAGEDADALLKQLTALLQQAQGAPFPIQAFKQAAIVGVLIGYENQTQALASVKTDDNAGRPAALQSSEKFRAAMAQVQKEPVAAAYVDVEAILRQVDHGVESVGPPEAKQMWPRIRDAVGIGGLKQLIWTGGFDGKDWSTQCFIAAPSPRTGILSLIDTKPLSDDLLRAVPKTATWVAAVHFDLGRLVEEVRTAAGKVDPQAQTAVDQVLGLAKIMLAVDIQKDLFESLGSQWAIYVDPDSAGQGMAGIVVVNRLAKPAEAERALGRLEVSLDNLINAQLRRQKMEVSFEQVKAGDLTIHYVAVPLVAPSWTIKDGNIYMALYPQIVVAAAQSRPAGGSILDNPDFQAIRKRLGGSSASGIAYMDLPRLSAESYQLLLMISRLGQGFADIFGVKTSPLLIPPLSKLREFLTPSGAASWADDAGWHAKSISPFPGSEMVASQASAVLGASAILPSVLLPSLNRARESANRVKSASNLRQIGQGMLLYANDNQGKYPATMGELLAEDLALEVFISPSSRTAIPPNVRNGTPQEKAQWVNDNSDYVYLGKGLKADANAERVLAYEKPEIHNGDGLNALFGDGHVEWNPVDRAMQMIQNQQAQKGAGQ